VLPVEFATFAATAEEGFATLTWATASETNNAGFVVEHKAPKATGFAEVGYVEGSGTTAEAVSYAFRAKVAEVGTHTFRLQQVDLDGTRSPSETITVERLLDGPYELAAYPNPFRTAATLDLVVREAQRVTVEVYNVLGQRVASLYDGTVQAQGDLQLQLPSQGLASGVYFVRVRGEAFQATRRVTLVR
jgi:hypothetical protein